MVAARMLADTLAGGGTLRDYEVAWQRKHGGVFAFFDVFRRWNQTVSEETIGRAMNGGLIDAETLRAGIDQALPRPSLRTVATKARGLIAQPVLAKVAARSIAVRALYASYPRRADRVATWARQVDRIMAT
jgi:hypothetical protein